ncbi:MAG TPA: hypothetical protein VK875_07495 [Euzebyales bacterium]|nr:hypothetical protein [Euzebyales bacterium]
MARPRDDLGGATAGAARRRVGGLLVTEARLLRRFGVLTAAVVVTGLWVVILRVVPPEARQILVPLVLLVDVTALGFLFVPALLVLERIEGVAAATRVTPVRTAERVAVRVGATTVVSLVAALAVTLAGDAPAVPVALLGVALASVLVTLVAFAVVGTSANLTTFLLRAPLAAAPLLAPVLVHATGLVDVAVLHLSPLTGALDMMRGTMSWAALAWLLVWIAGAASFVGHAARRPPPTAAVRPARPAAWPDHPGTYRRRTALRSLVRADRRTLVRDGLLLMLAGSVPLVALVGRLAATVGVPWLQAHHGVDLAPYLPVAWVVLLVVHTPMIFGTVAGLLLLEDRDAGLLPAIATTRASTGTLLAYRAGATLLCTAVALAVALPLAGVRHPAGAVGVVAVVAAAAALSVVSALLMAGFAENRVQGVAIMKLIGLPLYLPVASFFVDGAARWLFAPLPSSWVMWSLWSPSPVAAAGLAAAGVVCCAAIGYALGRRFLHRVAT